MDDLHAFAMQLRRHQGYTGDVSARPIQASYDAGSNRIAGKNDNGNLLRGVLCRKCARSIGRHDDVDFEGNQFSGKFGKQIELLLCRSEFELKILTLDITGLMQFFAQYCPKGLGVLVADKQCTNSIFFGLSAVHAQ